MGSKIFALLICATSLSFAKETNSQKYKVYILQPGDTLSELLQRENYAPLWGNGAWVERTLEANHLTMDSVKEIKKGMPIILPTDKDINKPFNNNVLTNMVKDDVKVAQAATIQTGIFAHKISKHQNYSMNFGYFYRDIGTSRNTIDSGENFNLSLLYNDKKNDNFFGFNANPTAELGVQAHGSNYTSDNVLNFQPTYFINSSLLFNKNDTISMGPNLRLENSSKAELDNEDISVRRDSLLWIGLEGLARYEKNNINYNFKGQIQTLAAAQNTADFNNLQGYRAGVEMEFNLLNNYYMGIFNTREVYGNSLTQNIIQTGINLRYILE
jgi:hypothetical protein